MNRKLILCVVFALLACVAVPALAVVQLPPAQWARFAASAVFANGKMYYPTGWSDIASAPPQYPTNGVRDPITGLYTPGTGIIDKAWTGGAPGTKGAYDYNRQCGFSIYTPGTDTWLCSNWAEEVQTLASFDMTDDGVSTAGEGTSSGPCQTFAYDYDGDYTEEIFVISGYPNWSGSLVRYDPDTNKWATHSASNPFGYFANNIAQVDKTTGTLWVVTRTKLAKYVFATDTWTTVTTTLPFDTNMGIGRISNGKLYVTLGDEPAPGTGLNVWVGDLSVDPPTWTQRGSLINKRIRSGSAIYNGKLYVFGGYNAAGVDQADVQAYDLTTGVTTIVNDMPVGFSRVSGVITPEGIAYMGEGRQNGLFGSNKWWKCDLTVASPTWTPIANDPALFPYQDWDAGGEPISGRVLDPNGKPMAGAVVGIKKAGNATADAKYYVVTDMSGTFTRPTLAPGNWKVAAWRSGFAPSADVSFTMGSEAQTIADIQITQKACANIAPTATATYSSNPNASLPAANAIDGNQNTRWSCEGNTGTDQFYTIDFGTVKDITGVVAYWETARPAAYSIDITTGDPNPTGSATWTTAYDCPKNTLVPGGGWNAGQGHWVDPIRFDSTKSARGVRFHFTKFNSGLGNYSAYELQVLGTQVLPTVSTLAEAKQLNDGDAVMVSKPVTASGGQLGTNFYIEESDRSNGIRVVPAEGVSSVGMGYLADVTGTMTTTPEGERAIAATSASGWFLTGTPAPLGMNNKTALSPLTTGLLIKPWGKVKSIGDGFFMLDDGSDPNAAGIKVFIGGTIQPEVDSFLSFQGVVGKEAGESVIYATKIDLTSGSIVGDGWIKAWLLNGYYQVANPNQPDPAWQVANLANDFLTAPADGGETGIKPFPGKISNTLPWSVYSVPTGTAVPLDTVFAGQTNGQKCTYAFVYLYSPEEYDGWPKSAQLRLGSDDGIRAWVNGELVHANDTVGRGVTPDQDQVLTTLHQGWNTLLLKINNINGGYGFCARVMTDDGTGTYVPLPGLKFSLYPQE